MAFQQRFTSARSAARPAPARIAPARFAAVRDVAIRATALVLAPLCAAALALGLLATPALAHDSLKSSTPASGSVVSEVDQVVLEFHDRVSFPAVVVHDSAGKRYDSGEPRADGPKVYENVAGPLPPGAYVIAWRIVSSDGHPVEGEIPFTVGGAGGAAASAAPAASAGSSGGADPGSAATAQDAAGQSPAAASTAQEPGGGIPVWAWVVIALLVVVAVVVGLRAARPGREGDSG
jgi:methionine-rich copper-binding protein CopC